MTCAIEFVEQKLYQETDSRMLRGAKIGAVALLALCTAVATGIGLSALGGATSHWHPLLSGLTILGTATVGGGTSAGLAMVALRGVRAHAPQHIAVLELPEGGG